MAITTVSKTVIPGSSPGAPAIAGGYSETKCQTWK